MEGQAALDERELQRPSSDEPSEAAQRDQGLHPFAPIYTVVNDTTSRTTHHPQVHYIFSDDDPDLLTHGLTQQRLGGVSGSHSTTGSDSRAVILDLTRNSEGGLEVFWASSLSPSWAVLDAQISRISPPSSESETGNGTDETRNKVDRLMLRIEGLESTNSGNEPRLRVSDEQSRDGSRSGSASASGSLHRKDHDAGVPMDYANLVADFERKMGILRKVVDASEDRRQKIGIEVGAGAAPQPQPAGPAQTNALPSGD